jgi:hypothetical protein
VAGKRGRPKGYKLSDDSKAKISASKTGQQHKEETKEQIAESVRKYYKTPEGLAMRQKMHEFGVSFWNSEEGKSLRGNLSKGMKTHYDKYFR